MFKKYTYLFFLLPVIAMVTFGCAATESFVYNRMVIPGSKESKDAKTGKNAANFSQGLAIDAVTADGLANGEAKVVIFREKSGGGSAMRLLFSIDGYAFGAVSSGDSISLRIPANKELQIGTAIIQETGNCLGYNSNPLMAQERKTYYYELKIGWRKCSIEPITDDAAQIYYQKGFKPVTTTYNVDWNLFFNGDTDYVPYVKLISKNGTTLVLHYSLLGNLARGINVDAAMRIDLYNASKSGDITLLKQLLAARVPVDGTFYEEGTPLSTAVQNGQTEAVKILLNAGAKPDVDLAGITPLMLASKMGRVDIAKLLLDAGADATLKSRLGDSEYYMTALGNAKKNGHEDIVNLLQEYGADE